MTRYESTLTTLDSVIRQLAKAEVTTPSAAASEYTDFATLMTTDIIPMVSSYITRYCDRTFVPYKESRYYYMRDLVRLRRFDVGYYNMQLLLDEDLLVTNGITWDGTALSATAWRELDPRWLPYYAVGFNPDDSNIYLDDSDYDNSLVIDGIWGYHTNLTNAWSTVDSSVTIASTSTTSITVASNTNYEILDYIRCESEYMRVTGRSSTTGLVVERGVNGTTAATHTAQPLQRYKILPDVRQAATRLASWAYQHRNDMGNRINFADGSSELVQIPLFVKEALDRLKRMNIPLGV